MTVTIRRGLSADSFMHPLTKAINEGLRTQEPIHRDRLRLFASDAGRCARKAVLHNLVDPEIRVTTSAAGKFYMGMGSAVHEKVTDAFFKQDILLFKELRIPRLDLNLGGFIDAVVFIDDHVGAVEIKTCGKLPGEIKPDHRSQALVYHAVTGFKTYVIYVSRNVASWDGKLQIQVLDLIPQPGEVEATLSSIAIAHLFGSAGVVPNKPARFTSADDCSFCPFVNMCWGSADMPGRSPSSEERVALIEQVAQRVSALIESTPQRRNGILKHIQNHGTEFATELLSTKPWNEI